MTPPGTTRTLPDLRIVPTERTMKGGRVDPSALRVGPSGRVLCRYCQVEVPVGRITFCSSSCVREWKVRTDKHFARRMVFRRDRGICARCGTSCPAWLKGLKREWKEIGTIEERPIREAARRSFRSGNPDFFRRSTFWDVDHIVPVVEGGGSCGVDNLRTLCIFCHRQVTAELNRKRASERRTRKERAE